MPSIVQRLLVGVLMLMVCSKALGQGQSCVNPAGQPGKCIPFRECQPLLAIYNKQFTTPEESTFLRNSLCGAVERKPLVCCPGGTSAQQPKQKTTVLPQAPQCGYQLTDRLFGGQATELFEFPWTALIEYQKPGGVYDFHCGGSLIHARYVLTAAHCVQGLPRGWKVNRVRLGEWDTRTEVDCQDGNCASAPVDLDIESIVSHRDYVARDAHENDIALVRFKRDVAFSDTIRPICLPLANPARSRNLVGLSNYAAGWGRTETASASPVKLKVALTVQDLAACSRKYQNTNTPPLKQSQLCAGGLAGKDTCSGDSGGPLMSQQAGTWYLYGVVSFGPNKCGTAGYPGVYTNVVSFLDWIQDNVQ
uniref:CLIP domain-containing serine protease n=1 Tax=Anopheles farauti TaxID=69004 RepID=A0A2C9GW66_9DIPT